MKTIGLAYAVLLISQVDAHDDILIVITEASAKDVDATWVASLLVNANPYSDAVMTIEPQFVEACV